LLIGVHVKAGTQALQAPVTVDDNRRLVERFVVEWLNERRRASLEEICHPQIAYHWGPLGDGRGIDSIVAQEQRARAAFPDITVEPSVTVADDSFVVNRSIVKGSHQGSWFGLAATGKRVTWTATEIYRIADSRIAEQWLNEDWASVLQQLNLLSQA
jgi:predicted ester cyclase